MRGQDLAAKTAMLTAEIANGSLVMVAFIGMFFQDGLTAFIGMFFQDQFPALRPPRTTSASRH